MINPNSEAFPRMLQMSLSDGNSTCFGVEKVGLGAKGLTLKTVPGTKIQLNGKIVFRRGFVMIDSEDMINVLGGML